MSGCENGHDWSAVGLLEDGSDIPLFPCRRNGCTAGRSGRDDDSPVIPNAFQMDFVLEDDPRGGVAKLIYREMVGYGLYEIELRPGDVVIDIGAHVGVISVYLARKCPDISIYAFEPSPDNYTRLVRNIAANGVGNVRAYNLAVSGDGQPTRIYGDAGSNTGGYSAFTAPVGEPLIVGSVTLADIFEMVGCERIRLLKIDCEGAEYGVLKAGELLLDRVDALVGEFHSNGRLLAAGESPDALRALCEQHIAHVRVTVQEMAE